MFDAYRLNASAPYAMKEEIDYLVEHGKDIKPKYAVMLGAGPGVLALALMDWYVQYKRVTPDLWIVDNNTTEWAERHLELMGVIPMFIHPVIADSAEYAKKWLGHEIGLLIVDADHSTEAVLRDIDAWFPHVASGGVIFFHDFLEREGGFNGVGMWKEGEVAKAIEQRQNLPWKFEGLVGISAIYRKL